MYLIVWKMHSCLKVAKVITATTQVHVKIGRCLLETQSVHGCFWYKNRMKKEIDAVKEYEQYVHFDLTNESFNE